MHPIVQRQVCDNLSKLKLFLSLNNFSLFPTSAPQFCPINDFQCISITFCISCLPKLSLFYQIQTQQMDKVKVALHLRPLDSSCSPSPYAAFQTSTDKKNDRRRWKSKGQGTLYRKLEEPYNSWRCTSALPVETSTAAILHLPAQGCNLFCFQRLITQYDSYWTQNTGWPCDTVDPRH